jgi:ABC-type Fe3+-hydroxamate transport system substrate-binding protein
MGGRFTDALGREHAIASPPRRIVSLVPSVTETLFELGLADSVAGVTDFCVHPAATAEKPRVGGTKNPTLEKIVALAPDLVLANKEENRRRDVERLEASGIPVFVTYARSVRQAVDEIDTLGHITGTSEVAARIVTAIEERWRAARQRRPETLPRVAALIWKHPYMAVGPDTFANDLIEQCCGQNAFGDRERRYPRIDEADLEAAQPDVVLLPTEPYEFDIRDAVELRSLDMPAARSARVHVVEGELLSWYGPRMGRALELFSGLFAAD